MIISIPLHSPSLKSPYVKCIFNAKTFVSIQWFYIGLYSANTVLLDSPYWSSSSAFELPPVLVDSSVKLKSAANTKTANSGLIPHLYISYNTEISCDSVTCMVFDNVGKRLLKNIYKARINLPTSTNAHNSVVIQCMKTQQKKSKIIYSDIPY